MVQKQNKMTLRDRNLSANEWTALMDKSWWSERRPAGQEQLTAEKPSFPTVSPSLNWLLSACHRILLPTVACLAAASHQTPDCLQEARGKKSHSLLFLSFVLFSSSCQKPIHCTMLCLWSVITPAIRSLRHKTYISAGCCSTMCITNGSGNSLIHRPLNKVTRHQFYF